MRVITWAAEKGGVGKTTSAINTATGLAEEGYRTMLIDLDAQSNVALGLGYDPASFKGKSTAELLEKTVKFEDVVLRHQKNLYILPGHRELYKTAKRLLAEGDGRLRLKKLLTKVRNIDYVIIDTAPGYGIINDNAYHASHDVIVPVEMASFSVYGLRDLIETLNEIREEGPDVDISGILLTKVNEQRREDRGYIKGIRGKLGPLVFKTMIPQTVRIGESQTSGKSIYGYERWGKASIAYKKFIKEVVERSGEDA